MSGGEHNESEVKKPLQPPYKDAFEDGDRAILDMALQLIPYGGVFLSFLNGISQSKNEETVENWQHQVTELLNDYGDQLQALTGQPTVKLDGLLLDVIVKLIRECPDGLANRRYAPEELQTCFQDSSEKDIEEVGYELQYLGLVKMSSHLGGWHLKLAPSAYVSMDLPIMGWDTCEDAHNLAQKILETGEGGSQMLLQVLEWEKRRFNPAQRLIIDELPSGRFRKTIQPDFVSSAILVSPEVTALLKQYIRRSDY